MRQNLVRISPKMRHNFFGKDQFPCNDWACLVFPNHLERCGTLDYLPSYGQPTPGAGASTTSTWPVRAPPAMLVVPLHSVATRNNVLLSAPPSAQAKQPRSKSIVCNTSPPSRTRTQRLLGTSPYQMAFSASRQMPSGAPSPRSAHTRRFDRPPSAAMSKAVSLLPYD